MKIKKYESYWGHFLDFVAYFLTVPFGYALDSCFSSYWLTTNHKSSIFNAFKFCILGPVFGLLALLLLPNFILGYCLWIFVCYVFSHNDFTIISFNDQKDPVLKSTFSMASANLLLGQDSLGKFQNMDLVYKRAFELADRLVTKQTNCPLGNVEGIENPTASQKFEVEYRSLWMKLVDFGCLMAKVDLGQDSKGMKHVGFVANLHMMAYQGKHDLVYASMSNVQREFSKFRKRKLLAGERVDFAVISGDFNSDNISPGDESSHDHPIFNSYDDFPRLRPGCDKSWSIGTELRQLRIYDKEFSSPAEMKDMLIDNVKRRHFVIDADVEEATMDLMYCLPKPNSLGEVVENPKTGGRRRIDRILVDKSIPIKTVGYAFVSSLAGQTDHIPIAISLETQNKNS